MSRYYDSYWPPYVPVAERRRHAAKKVAKMKKAGRDVSPVEIAGRKIVTTFWGAAWCKNLEAYSDYSNRLPRGRTYVRNGSVVDLRVEAGRVRALVSGTDLYTVDIKIEPLAKKRWTDIKGKCAGQIDSLVELLQGSISKGVMEIVTRKGEGLFPSPREITLSCSCPDWATMCKHVAATLYGVGARLDHDPELLFALRGVDPTEMVEAAVDQPRAAGKARKARMLETDELSSVFGVDIDMKGVSSKEASTPTEPAKKTRRTARARKSATSRASKKKTGATPATRRPAAAKPTAKKAAATKQSTLKKATPTKAAATKAAATKAAATKAAATKAAATKAAATKAAATKKAATKAAATKKAAAKRTAARKAPTTKKTTAKKAADKKTSTTKKATAKRVAGKKAPTTRKTTAKKVADKKASTTRKTTASKADSKKAAAKKVSSVKKPTSEKPATKRTSAKKSTPKKSAAKKATTKKAASKKRTSKGKPAAKKAPKKAKG